MIIYHGSTVPVEAPKILKNKRKLDFGEGFYTTFNREQAISWSERIAERRNSKFQIISEYEFDLEAAKKELLIIQFDKPDDDWLSFVSANRVGNGITEAYDVAIGAVANDFVFATIVLYEQGFLDREETIKRLKIQELYNQVLFHTEKSLRFCRYIKHETIGGI